MSPRGACNTKEVRLKNVAFLTYNSVGEGLGNGWHASNGRRALVLQNTKGARWLADQGPLDPDGHATETGRVRDEISSLWDELQKGIADLDHVVVYVGSDGSEQAIALAAKLPEDKVTLVACGCGLFQKKVLARALGLPNPRWVRSECGGHRTMKSLYECFMETGELLPVAA